jgi:hypothetical protein
MSHFNYNRIGFGFLPDSGWLSVTAGDFAGRQICLLRKHKMYLDPGSGSVVLQVALAALLGAGVIVRLFWKKIKSIGGKKQAQEAESGDDLNSHGPSDQ